MDKNYINQKADAALRSLEDIERAEPQPYFFTRLEARMLSESNVWNIISSFFSKPVIAFACICIVIMINMAAIFSSAHSNTLLSRQAPDLTAADEYSQVTTSLYELDK
ncbi:MAG: hypothetical protein ABIR19_10355 [Ginsengibacter sp.]